MTNDRNVPLSDEQVANAHLNPDYGSGIFRRRILMEASEGQVFGQLEDSAHGFRCLIKHDGKVVTSVEGESLRTPYDTCQGATEPIKALVGQGIDIGLAELNREVNARLNCTHLYDLAALSLETCHLHVSEGRTKRQIDVVIPDEHDGPSDAKVFVDGEEIICWQLEMWQIKGPAEIAGKPLHRGFAAWVNERYSGIQNTAAFALQKGYLVAESRRYDMDRLAGESAEHNEMMIGACYTFTPEIIRKAQRRVGTMRDFSNDESQLLQFK